MTLIEQLKSAIQLNDLNARERLELVPRFAHGDLARASKPATGVIPRRGAVLIALYQHNHEFYVVLTERSGNLRSHTGEIAFPGGAIDDHETAIEAALREAYEEINLSIAEPLILGTLSETYISVSNFAITPVVVWLEQQPSTKPNPHEVASVIHLPLRQLIQPQSIQIEERTIRGQALTVPFYPFEQYKIWGATSIILAQLVARLRPILHPIHEEYHAG